MVREYTTTKADASSGCHGSSSLDISKERLLTICLSVSLCTYVLLGGHKADQQIETFKEMFWHVKDGGVYLCEDMHTSYWYGQGGEKQGTFAELTKGLVDTINAWDSELPNVKVSAGGSSSSSSSR